MTRRGIATVSLVGITCLLTLLSTFALWLRALVLDTDSYVKAVGPVLDHAEVRDALAETIVATLYAHVDVTAELRAALPDRAAQFAPTLAASIRATSVQIASAALATSAVRSAWRSANRIAHDQLVHVLEGRGEVVTTVKGEVAIDTQSLAVTVRRVLDERGIHVFDQVPTDAIAGRFVLFRSTALMHAQRATRILDDVATWFPIATVAAGAGALGCSTRRRRTAEQLAVAVAGVMVLVSLTVAVGRAYYLARVGTANRTIAAAPFDALVTPLRTGVRFTFAGALVALVVVWFWGSERLVAQERRARAVVVDLMHRNARPLAVAGAALTAVVLVAWDRPRPLVVAGVLTAGAAWELACLLAGRSSPLSAPSAGPLPHHLPRGD